jgi:hypothetical protein
MQSFKLRFFDNYFLAFGVLVGGVVSILFTSSGFTGAGLPPVVAAVGAPGIAFCRFTSAGFTGTGLPPVGETPGGALPGSLFWAMATVANRPIVTAARVGIRRMIGSL